MNKRKFEQLLSDYGWELVVNTNHVELINNPIWFHKSRKPRIYTGRIVTEDVIGISAGQNESPEHWIPMSDVNTDNMFVMFFLNPDKLSDVKDEVAVSN